MAIERETFQKSRLGFDLLYKELQKKYENECLSKQVSRFAAARCSNHRWFSPRQDIETEYQLQLAQKNDFIEATKYMEKDAEVKTTLYNEMKGQIDGIKDENVRLSERLQVRGWGWGMREERWFAVFQMEIQRNEEREQQVQLLEKENIMLRQTISQLEMK